MKAIDFYKLFTGSETAFIDSVPEGSQELAESYWFNLNHATVWFIVWMLFWSIGLCVFYFTAYNNMPGRHYKLSHWIGFYIAAALISFVGTGFLGHMLTNTTLTGSASLVWHIAFGNLLYSIGIFGLLSVIWWIAFPTNAYCPFGKK